MKYTIALADLLSGWLPEGISGSISTVPCFYAPDYPDDASRNAAVQKTVSNLVEVARHLDKIAETTGREIYIGLEPEPWCYLEKSDDILRFFCNHLFAGEGHRFESMLRRRVGVCIDTCHCALAFEDPADVVRTCDHAGIRIVKIQLSAALSISGDVTRIREKLLPFADPVYFHQSSARKSGTVVGRWPDLPEALRDLDTGETPDELRIHYHVPLHWPGDDELKSTRTNMSGEFWKLVKSGICPHLEIETYTFHVLPESLAKDGLYGSIAKEYEWVLEEVSSAGIADIASI
jgi:hypothetical protein